MIDYKKARLWVRILGIEGGACRFLNYLMPFSWYFWKACFGAMHWDLSVVWKMILPSWQIFKELANYKGILSYLFSYHALALMLHTERGLEGTQCHHLLSTKVTQQVLYCSHLILRVPWEMLSTFPMISKSSVPNCLSVVLSCWVVFPLKYLLLPPCGFECVAVIHRWFLGYDSLNSSVLVFLYYVTDLWCFCAFLCLLFQVLKSVLNKLFHYAPETFEFYLNEPGLHFTFFIHLCIFPRGKIFYKSI